MTGHIGVVGIVRSMSRAPMTSGLFVALALASLAPDIVDMFYFVLRICSPYVAFPEFKSSLQLLVGAACLNERGDISIGIFPQREDSSYAARLRTLSPAMR